MKKCVILDADGVNPGDLSWDAIAGVTDLTVHNIYQHPSGGGSLPHWGRGIGAAQQNSH